MFSSRISTISKSKIFIGYARSCGYINQAKQCLWTSTINHCANIQINKSLSHLVNCSRKFGSQVSPREYNVFGNISHKQYERVEMDEDEKEEEILAEGARIPRHQTVNYKEYCRLIKTYMVKKNLKLAISVLDLMKESGDKPNLYVYRLLISAFAKQGDVEQCFKLFKKLKDSGLQPSAKIYTSLIESCARSKNKQLALNQLRFLRTHFYKKGMQFNIIQYCALIKAYGWHNEVLTAFEIADEAQDNKCVSNSMIAALFQAAISDTKHGLKYALALWHKMKKNNMNTNIYHYNLLLRAIRDTEFGDLKINAPLLSGSYDTQIQLKDVKRPNLLDSPPVFSTWLLRTLEGFNKTTDANTKEIDIMNNIESSSLNLNKMFQGNRLFLFGGFENFLNRMKSDGATPNEKTLTLILDILPSTIEAETQFLKYIKQNSINVDITFFNMLIRKRCLRGHYEDAKSVLNEIQTYHFTPNIVTFGVLAIGCKKLKDGVELLEQMDNIGYIPNNNILETLLLQACYYKNFSYVSYLMSYLLKNHIEPSKDILKRLEQFDENMLKYLDNEVKSGPERGSTFKTSYNKFKIKYELWKEKLETSANS